MERLTRQHVNAYSTLAPEYEALAALRRSAACHRANRLLDVLPARSRVLDVGCGVGATAHQLSQAGYVVAGIDASQAMAAYAIRRAPKCHIEVADVLEFRPRALFDAVVADAFIHLFPKAVCVEVLGYLRRLVRPGGLISISTTLHPVDGEGWCPKPDYRFRVRRFRSRWTEQSLDHALWSARVEPVNRYRIAGEHGKIWSVVTAVRRDDDG
jgi:SAM-dependent methyltransferase